MSVLVLVLLAFLQTPAGRPMRTLEKGAISNIDTANQVIIRSMDGFAKLWQAHSPDRPMPPVDFARDMIVGVFLGSRPTAGYAVEIAGTHIAQGVLVVRYRVATPAPDLLTAQVLTSPYHLVLVPRHAGDVRFEKIE